MKASPPPAQNLLIAPLPFERFEEMAGLWVASWAEAMPALDFSTRGEWIKTHMAQLADEGAKLIGAYWGDGGPLLGFVAVHPATHYLDQLAVACEAKGEGVAGALLSAARHISPQQLDLDVNVDNPRALRFYEKQGFRRIGEGISPRTGLALYTMRWHPTWPSDQASAQQQ